MKFDLCYVKMVVKGLRIDMKDIDSLQKQNRLKDWHIILITSLIFSILPNLAFWHNTFYLQTGTPLNYLYFYCAMIIFAICVLNVFFALVFWRVTKWLVILLLLISALFGYFSFSFNIYVDLHMLLNIVETNTGETLTLITPYLLAWLLGVFLLPAILIYRLKFPKVKCISTLKNRLIIIFTSVALLLATSLPVYNYYASFFRNNNQIIKQLTPSNYLVASSKYLSTMMIKPLSYRQIALDAVQMKSKEEVSVQPRLLILVVGETSRAQNFSLNGYEKNTNPRLGARTDIVNFSEATSCGTATAISVPCMFSNLTRSQYKHELAISQDNILDILQRANISVLWQENDEGCKGVCGRVPTTQIIDVTPEAECPSGLCYDENQLTHLSEFINKQTQDTIIVLHTNGSHGPAYYQRYPIDFQGKFVPTCDTNQIQSCDEIALMNTYDNTILYVDYLLDKTITLLNEHPQFATAMLYLSDHGESLGEKGLYLHAAPYMMAPKEQNHIPFIMWLSPLWLSQDNIQLSCLQQFAKEQPVSHDNLFHTLLGLFRINTQIYQADLDVTATCRK